MKNSEKTLDMIVNLCKNRGFISPGSEIYGSPQGGCRIVDGHDHTDMRRHNVLHSFQNSFFHFGVKPVIGQGQRGQAL